MIDSKKAQWVHAQVRERRSLERVNRKSYTHVLKECGYTKEEICNKLNLSSSTISQYLREGIDYEEIDPILKFIEDFSSTIKVTKKKALSVFETYSSNDKLNKYFFEYLEYHANKGKSGNRLVDNAEKYAEELGSDADYCEKNLVIGGLLSFFYLLGYFYIGQAKKWFKAIGILFIIVFLFVLPGIFFPNLDPSYTMGPMVIVAFGFYIYAIYDQLQFIIKYNNAVRLKVKNRLAKWN